LPNKLKNASWRNRCWRTTARPLTRSCGRTKRACAGLLLCLLYLTPLTNSAHAQQRSASPASEVERLRTGLNHALAELAEEKAKRAEANDAITALTVERDDARKALTESKAETATANAALATAHQALDSAERGIAAQQIVIASFEKALDASGKLIDRYEVRLAKTEASLDKANARTVKVGMGAFIAGAVIAAGKKLIGL
jgi:hypothetical protein